MELSKAAIEWLASGERGISSEAIFAKMTGMRVGNGSWGMDPPHDPADIKRCEKLLRAVPEFRARLPEMAEVSPVWGNLVAKWDEIIAKIYEEAPEWEQGRGKAPEAYRMIQECWGRNP